MAKKKPKEDPHAETRRLRDLTTIRDLFSVFPRTLVATVLDEALADRIVLDHIDCLIDAEHFFHSPLFHLNDTVLLKLLGDFFHHWGAAWDVGRATHHDGLGSGTATLILCETDPA